MTTVMSPRDGLLVRLSFLPGERTGTINAFSHVCWLVLSCNYIALRGPRRNPPSSLFGSTAFGLGKYLYDDKGELDLG